MRKVISMLVVLVMAAPLYAGHVDFTVDNSEPDELTITYVCTGDPCAVAMGLDIDVLTGTDITLVDGMDSFFDIYPDIAYDMETASPNSYTYGAGSNPAADQNEPGEETMPSSHFCISMGGLGGDGSEALNDPPASGTVAVLHVAADEHVTGKITINLKRGGVVDGAGNAMTTNIGAGIPFEINPPQLECVKDNGTTHYDDWVAWGKPDCWCYRRHCKGDADGIENGPFHVALPDLNILRTGFNVPNAMLPAAAICADFDHLQNGPFRVALPDLNLLRPWFNKPALTVPECPMDDYNFWTN